MTSVPATRARHCCWTLNNWEQQDLICIRDYAKSVTYLCFAKEVGDSGTPHLQGYVAWGNPHSLDKFRKDIGGRLHYEPNTRGTAQQNRLYCLGMVAKKGMTPNDTFEEYGELPSQGTRTDWASAVESLRSQGVADVIMEQPQLTPCIRALERFKCLCLKPLNRNVSVTILVGATGTGKSSSVYDKYPDLYSKPDGQWFDGYTGQKTILLDDYYGSIPYGVLLKICDRYPFNAPVKGGYVWAQWDNVIITSNTPPDTWYTQDLSAFNRRITYLNLEYTQDAYDNETKDWKGQACELPQTCREETQDL